MRRLRNSRAPEPDDSALDGLDRLDLEGDAIAPAADELPWLRPFGGAIPGQTLPASPAGPENPPPAEQARELAVRGRRLDAVLLLRRHLEDIPTDAGVRAELAVLLELGGEPAAALVELDLALSHADDPVPLLVQRGALATRAGRPVDGERDLRDAIRRVPAHPPAHLHLGITLLRLGRAGEAAEALREALRLAPDDPEAAYQLGEAVQAQGDLAGALGLLERAAGLAPADPRSYKLMGRLLDRLGRSEEALVMHRRAREVGIR